MARILLVALLLSLTAVGTGSVHAGADKLFLVNVASNIGDNNIADGVCDVDPGSPGDQCTFRAALQESNDEIGFDEINFAPGMTQAIVSSAPLPSITHPVVIDGSTAGCGATACIRISGDAAPAGPNGLIVTAAGGGTTIRGLILVNWANAGIILGENTTNVTIAGNYIGTDATGLVAEGNNNGIIIAGSSNSVGGPNTEDRNVISGNSGYGIALWGPDVAFNVIENNYIGVGVNGTTPLGNSEGIHFNTSAFSGRVASSGGGGGNVIGPGNVISNNQNEGICLCAASGNTVIGNYIGVDASGNAAAPNDVGIFAFGSDNTIGGDTPSERNIISGNDEYGIDISNSHDGSGNVISGNYIGTNAAGNASLGNGRDGITTYANSTTIGGDTASERNVISGNGTGGISASGEDVVIEGNYIGVGANGEAAIGNKQYGVSLGGGVLLANNVISDNDTFGVLIQFADGNEIIGNRIGVTAAGNPRGNGSDGIRIAGASDNLIGDLDDGANIIAHNGASGVSVIGNVSGGRFSGAGPVPPPALGNSIRGNSIHSNAGLGIDNVTTGNGELAPPVINTPLRAGIEISGTACPSCKVDIFSDDQDEGRVFEGTASATGLGFWFFQGDLSGPFMTATATDADGNTSEFSAPVAVSEPQTPTPEPTQEPTPTPSLTPVPSPTPSPTPGPTATPAEDGIQGDTDCDKDVDTVDGLFVLRDVAGFPPSKCIQQGDTDCDGDRDSVDALGILRHVAALPPLVQQEPCPDIGTPT